jgi:hypothetical protein
MTFCMCLLTSITWPLCSLKVWCSSATHRALRSIENLIFISFSFLPENIDKLDVQFYTALFMLLDRWRMSRYCVTPLPWALFTLLQDLLSPSVVILAILRVLFNPVVYCLLYSFSFLLQHPLLNLQCNVHYGGDISPQCLYLAVLMQHCRVYYQGILRLFFNC